MVEFYPFYLSQHTNKICRRLHFSGTIFALIIAAYSVCLVSPGNDRSASAMAYSDSFLAIAGILVIVAMASLALPKGKTIQ
ncbi:Mpo1-like protein [Lysobacter sp. A289]